jgi:ubiquinone/menaquinone biosynthesis C-methylase UbiE
MMWSEKEKQWTNTFNILQNQKLVAFNNIVTASQYWLAYDIFLKICPPPSPNVRLLDWGCGTGHFSYFLLEAGFATDSLNLNNKKLHDMGEVQIYDLLKSNFESSFRYRTTTDPVKLPYPENSFDSVVSIGTLEHVRETGGNEIKSLMEIYRVLKKGGIFFCYHFPNKFSWIDAVAKRIASKPYAYHRHKFTKKNIKTLNKTAGLTVETIKGYAFFPRNSATYLPGWLSNNPTFVKLFNRVDSYLGCAPICQNYLFWSKK